MVVELLEVMTGPPNFEMHKQTLELLMFLLHWFFEKAELKSRPSTEVTTSKSKTSDAGPWVSKSVNLRGKALDIYQKILFLNLDVIFIATSQRDLVINDMIFKSIRLCLENHDLLKNSSVKITISDMFCHCALKYESSFKVLSSHLQDFLREDHLSEFVAEIIDSSIINYEQKAIMENITKFVGSRIYSDKDQDMLAKSTAKFLIKLSEIQPGEIIKQMVKLIELLDSESPTIRAAMIDVMDILPEIIVKLRQVI
jgi:condensin complex subunit 1